MSRKSLLIVVLLLAVALAGCGGAAPEVDWTLGISGAVSSPLSLSFAELAEMPQTDLTEILMEKSLGEDTTGDWSGVALAELLDKAGAGEYVSITAVADDGYAIEISKDELQDAIVALKENGEWIAEVDPDHGPIRMVCPHTPANRWVFQLRELQVNAEAAGVPDDALTVLLYHSPDLALHAAERRVDLYLGGHTHGGQIRLPLYGAVVTGSRYGRRYVSGLFHEDDMTMIISRGLGFEGGAAPRARFLCRPQIVSLTLQGE